jgi:transcriptional regulator with GAF, ATPase, and Fis domain
MPSLIVREDAGKSRIVPLFKRITTLGRGAGNDVVLRGRDVEEHHAQIVFDGRQFSVTPADRKASLEVNGKRRKEHTLADGDAIVLGGAELRFSLYDEQRTVEDEQEDAVQVLERLVRFSDRIMAVREIEPLLQQLLDDIIEVTSADKGFLILLRDGAPSVQVARNIEGQTLPQTDATLSDSIIRKVLDTKKPVIVSDALHDGEFAASVSVVNLKLCSVMCLPLLARGELLGVLYLGNDNIVNLFAQRSLELARVYATQAALVVRNALLLDELAQGNERLRGEIESLRFGEIIGACPSMRDIYRKIERLASTDISVLIGGETGTGKELIAKEIHSASPRRNGPFVVINCGAIPENLLESELFGHVRGAFTGAVSTVVGKFQAAQKGTLFLDEVGETSLSLQVKLLRAIQEKQVTKVGDTRPESVDIRIIAATNRVLQEEVRAGRFREDLYYRLNVVSLTLPPLRDRGDDVLLLAHYYMKKYASEFNSPAVDFSKEAMRAIRKHRWPGNIRELQNRIKKATVFADGPLVKPADLGLDEELVKKVLPLAEAKEEFQRRYIDRVLALNDGNRTKTARDLDVDPRTIFRHLEKKREDGSEELSYMDDLTDV